MQSMHYVERSKYGFVMACSWLVIDAGQSGSLLEHEHLNGQWLHSRSDDQSSPSSHLPLPISW